MAIAFLAMFSSSLGQGFFVGLGLRGRALGLVGMGIMPGEILMPPVIAVLLVWLGWRELRWSFCLLLADGWGIAQPVPATPETRGA